MSEEIIITAIQGLNTAAVNLLVLLLFFKIYQPKYNSRLLYFISYIVTTALYIAVNILVARTDLPLLNFVYTLIHVIVYCLLLFDCDIKRSVIINELFALFCTISETLTTVLCTVISNDSLESVLGKSQYVAVSCLMNVLLSIVVWRIFVLILTKKDHPMMTLRQILLFVIFAVFEIYTIIYLTDKVENGKDGFTAIIIMTGFVILNAYIVYFIDESAALYQKQNEYNLMLKQNKLQLENFREISRKYEESKKTIHDIKKHLSALSALDNIDENRAEEYKSIIEHKIDSLFYEFHCSNQLLSIIMSQKMILCRSENINVNTKVDDISFDFMEDYDITAIFANLWDNAIEACREISESDRKISVTVGQVNDFVLVSFENSFNGELRKNGDTLKTTKKDHDGVGLTIIKSTVEKYNGYINIENDDNIFKVEIMFPINK